MLIWWMNVTSQIITHRSIPPENAARKILRAHTEVTNKAHYNTGLPNLTVEFDTFATRNVNRSSSVATPDRKQESQYERSLKSINESLPLLLILLLRKPLALRYYQVLMRALSIVVRHVGVGGELRVYFGVLGYTRKGGVLLLGKFC